ncbi:ABC transporter substrate-binding protein [Pararhizobium mangrovi]|uniref:Extracellular solute-binding protein n=1 Tax=Pararhizobium mangrovi TaxID=2590452 RepID=A0A506TZA2_9HYPH|nr:extracellular solute-binding protein [Pararhizobium mangrovi]TPW27412.1 extracellular solute-binding protein [Pararhizobium mangrovi]
MRFSVKTMMLGAAAAALMTTSALAGTITINTDTSDPGPKGAFKYAIDAFQKANPDVKVKWNVFDHEGFKSAIRNFLTADAPDVVTWYSGNRMLPFVDAHLFADISDLWSENDLDSQLKSAKSAVSANGKQWAIPYSYYPWAIYYRKDIFEKQGIEPPKTWDDLLADCKKLSDAGITPFAIGTKALWPAAGWFDYLDLRTNGYAFHMKLTQGEVPYTDERVKKVFENWAQLVKPGYFTKNAAALDWQDAVPLFVQGKAAMYLMGNFAVDVMKNAGLDESKVGFVSFPTINKDVPRAEDAPTEMVAMAANASNKEDARKFMAFIAKPETQAKMNDILGQLPVNSQSKIADDPLLQQGAKMLSSASNLSQFYDRDAPAQMAKAGMEGFQQFMAQPDQIDQILQRLESVRKRVYSN